MNPRRLRAVINVLGELAVEEATRGVRLRRRHQDEVGLSGEQHRARALRRGLERLGPFYIKVGQVLATRPDLVSQTVIDELDNLHDHVTVSPFEDFLPVLEADLGAGWREYLTHIGTDEPLGTASLAQVYQVTLAGGRDAVVKLQRPGIRATVLDDMKLIRRAARHLARRAPDFNSVIDIEAMLSVIFDAMEPELDFTVEAANMDAGRRATEGFEHVTVPRVIHATPRVLVEDIAPGRSIRDVNRDEFSSSQRQAIGRDLLAYMFRGYFLDQHFHADPHPGNIFVAPGEPAHLIDWGMVGRIDRHISMSMVLVLLAFSQNDGPALAKAWIELGRATSWADIPGFASDLSRLIPKYVGATMEDINLGVSLTSVLTYATRRGIQTSPLVAVLGKSFANIDGSVRYLAPELSVVDIFRDQMQGIVLELASSTLSEAQAAHTALEMMIGATTAPDDLRTLLKDVGNRELTLQLNEVQSRRSRREDRADARAARLRRTLVAMAAAGLWWDLRRRRL